jgi:hypothetical protein
MKLVEVLGQGWMKMKRFHEFCIKVKVVAVEVVALLGFFSILALGLVWEWNHLFPMVAKWIDDREDRYPMLRGAIQRPRHARAPPVLAVFACEEDLSHESPDAPLPEVIASGAEPLIVIGAIAGG